MKTSLRLYCERPQIATSGAARKVFLSSAVTLGVTGAFSAYLTKPPSRLHACFRGVEPLESFASLASKERERLFSLWALRGG